MNEHKRAPWLHHERWAEPPSEYSLVHFTRDWPHRVRVYDHHWNQIDDRAPFADAVKARPNWWGWATTDPHRHDQPQWPRQHARRTVLHGPTSFAIQAVLKKRAHDNLIANGIEPSLWVSVAGRHYIGGWWTTPDIIVDLETRQRLADQARTALAAQ